MNHQLLAEEIKVSFSVWMPHVEHFFNRKKDQEFINPLNSTLNVREDWNKFSQIRIWQTVIDVVKDGIYGIRV
ncbi:hypothetical protein ACOSQ2_007891 [Xanthoceras sorbifolium]